MAAPTDALALRLDCRVRTSRKIGRIFDSGRGVFSSASSWTMSTTPLSPAELNFPALAWSCTTSMISWSTSAKRSVAWRNSPLHELLCVSQKVASLTCALICDWRRRWIANQSWLQMPVLLDFSISFVVTGTRQSLKLIQHQHLLYVRGSWAVWVWLGCMYRLAWRQRAQIAHEEHAVLSMHLNDFDEPEISQTRPSKILPQASPVAACLIMRPEHTMPGAKQTNCFRFRPLRRCLKL